MGADKTPTAGPNVEKVECVRNCSHMTSAKIWPQMTPPPPPCHFTMPPQGDVNQNVHLPRTHTGCIIIGRYIVLILIFDKNKNYCLLTDRLRYRPLSPASSVLSVHFWYTEL